jgi:hypothetical protein
MQRLSAEQIEAHAWGAANAIRDNLAGSNQHALGFALSITLETLGTLAAQLIERMDAPDIARAENAEDALCRVADAVGAERNVGGPHEIAERIVAKVSA